MENEMKEITVERDGDRPLKFVGERIAHERTTQDFAKTYTAASIFKTRGGKYIYAEEYTPSFGRARHEYTAYMYRTLDELFEDVIDTYRWRGNGRVIEDILKPLAEQANYDLSKRIE
jgi:hypothetical protein